MKRFFRKRRCSVGNENQNAWDTNKSWIILLLHSAVKKTTKCIISLILLFVHNLIKESHEIKQFKDENLACKMYPNGFYCAKDIGSCGDNLNLNWQDCQIYLLFNRGDYSKVWSDMELSANRLWFRHSSFQFM